ncbi:MAG TPA: N-acetylmuramoyl-L-alanine amidase, partial [Azospirillaceae bacterium]|nr:N-acetylmuramoyl-L-alanine amidase [Azospirillaceae bacterium]
RKEDPGELFDWPGLARAGIGLWPEPVPADDGVIDEPEVRALLTRFGYDATEDLKTVLFAFQRHFHPQNLTGRPYPESVRRLRALVRQAGL